MPLPDLRLIRFPRPTVVVVVLIAAAWLAQPAAAEQPPQVDCENAMSTVEMNICAERSFEKADGALNAAYQSALRGIPSMAVDQPFDAKSWTEALRKSQRAWLAYRDAECKDHVPMHWTGGTGTTAEVLGCMETLTEARTKELRDRYEPQ